MPVKAKTTKAKTAQTKTTKAKAAKTATKAKATKASSTAKAKKAPAKKTAAPKKPATKLKAKPAAKAVKKPTPAKKAPAKAKAPAKPKKAKTAKPKTPAGFPEILRDAALKVLDERQADEIVTIDLQGRSAMADYAIVATGRSARQLAAISDYLRQAFFQAGVKNVRIEGVAQGDWVLIDAGDILIHLFRPEVRSYYRIEEIWSATHPART